MAITSRGKKIYFWTITALWHYSTKENISLSPIYFISPVTIKSDTHSNSCSAILTDPGDPDPGDVQLFWVLVLLTTGGMEMLPTNFMRLLYELNHVR